MTRRRARRTGLDGAGAASGGRRTRRTWRSVRRRRCRRLFPSGPPWGARDHAPRRVLVPTAARCGRRFGRRIRLRDRSGCGPHGALGRFGFYWNWSQLLEERSEHELIAVAQRRHVVLHLDAVLLGFLDDHLRVDPELFRELVNPDLGHLAPYVRLITDPGSRRHLAPVPGPPVAFPDRRRRQPRAWLPSVPRRGGPAPGPHPLSEWLSPRCGWDRWRWP